MPEKMDFSITTETGSVTFANDVIATIAGLAATDVHGVAGMSGGGGLAELLGRKNLAKGIRIAVGEENSLVVYAVIIVTFGTKLQEVGSSVQTEIKKAVENMTGLTVANVHVTIQGLMFDKAEALPAADQD